MGKSGHWHLAFSSWLVPSRSNSSSLPKDPSASKHTQEQSHEPPSSGQKPRANGQLPCFQDFACKSHGLKILPGKFFTGSMESGFYGVPGGVPKPPAVSHQLSAKAKSQEQIPRPKDGLVMTRTMDAPTEFTDS